MIMMWCDVAMIQETKLRAEDGEAQVGGYEMLRRDRWKGEKLPFHRLCLGYADSQGLGIPGAC